MTMDRSPSGFLVVGAGFLGSMRAAAVSACASTRVVAVHDCDGPAAERVARRHGAVAVSDFSEALAMPGVEVVIVATPHADHFSQTLQALEAGKHVLCEKPLTVRPDDARLLAIRADELRVRLATGLNHRFYPPVSDAIHLASSGAIGRVESVRAEIGHMASSEFLASWHTDPERSGGGTLIDNGPHACDLIRLFLGEIVAAKGYRRTGAGLAVGCESEAHALFRDDERRLAEVRSSWTQPTGYLTVEVRGAHGWLKLETAPWRLTATLSDGQNLRRDYLVERVQERLFLSRFGCERSLVREIEAFVAPMSRTAATGWDGCRVTEMIDAVYRSDETGMEVGLDPLLVHLPSTARRRVYEARFE